MSAKRERGCCGCWGCVVPLVLVLLALWAFLADVASVRSRLTTWLGQQVIGAINPFQSSVKQTLTTALGQLQPDGGLIVGWREVQAQVHVDRTTSIGAFGYEVPLGSVKIDLWVPGNRVQYLLPVNEDWNARMVDPSTVLLTVPPPEVNDRVVEVQSDRSKVRVVIDNDWAEHIIPSGGDVEQATALLRGAVLEAGSSRPALAEVRMDARHVAREHFRGLFSQAFSAPVDVIVRFSDEDEPGTQGSGGK